MYILKEVKREFFYQINFNLIFLITIQIFFTNLFKSLSQIYLKKSSIFRNSSYENFKVYIYFLLQCNWLLYGYLKLRIKKNEYLESFLI